MLERADPAHFQIFAHRLLNPCVARTKYEHLSTHILAPDRCRRSPPTCTLPVPAYFRRLESQEFQSLGPDPIPPRACARARDAARDANGRFAKGYSGNPKGRPRGIRNPRRRPLELLLRQARPGTLAPLVRRKRYLRLPVLSLVLPPARQPDPGERLGIDFSRMRSAAEIAAAIGKALTAVSRGDITPREGLRLARRARKPLRALRRQLWRDLARLEALRCGASAPPNLLSTNSLLTNSLFNREKFPVLREFRPTRRLLAASRCISEAESGKIKRLVLIFIRFARGHTRARAAVFQGQADRRYSTVARTSPEFGLKFQRR